MFSYDKYATLRLDTKNLFTEIVGNVEPDIRPLTLEHMEDYWQLRRQALRQNPEAFAVSYEEAIMKTVESVSGKFQQMDDDDNRVIGAFFEDALVGMVQVSRCNMLKMRHKAVISEMYVVPEARGHKLGFELMKAAISYVHQIEGIEQVQLTVATTNASARRLYQSFGFKVFGLERHGLKVGTTYLDGTHMVLFLNSV